ncbi:hypothetical protein DSO57_1039089 [Entomophthora muscae]|uniref:Uncharacterized protein n=1 Tax=Entomophthora muscae TaxID=34485 RepID=A0ACC2S0U1_9FUNG|nr:hypothetical protein DSO57_1039089 [Entomophthora muscae]
MYVIFFIDLFALTSAAGLWNPTARIFGGGEVTPKFKYNWLTSLSYRGKHKCGGTLLNSCTVLTAAHCVYGRDEEWRARFHRHNLTLTSAEENGRESRIFNRTVHPNFDTTGNNENDVAIWKVRAGVASFVFLDTGKFAVPDTLLRVVGWGITEARSGTSPILKEVKVPVYDPAKCRIAFPELDASSQFCAGYPEGGRDACQADSGGPIFHISKLRYTLVGIVSYGEGCGEKGFPGVYTNISTVKHFILSNLR